MKKLTLDEIKHKVLEWEDFYGQDIVQTDLIKKAKTKKVIKEIIQTHIRWLHLQNIDAVNDAEIFIKELGLKYLC